ncbi:sugar ABC transporter substrate-binding protein [Nocardiopsis gilva YIM 90087]|uniref:Sugar ABC transporter substrate-binding protein n=1 Tax=Nocardiopsis gilva YIM 90087 TaxID=1235441 RepID=A0A223SAG4_9ACTN|nr:sugar ABC transporter substrate-binding protein [Nocardiopsis gilva]ASU85117.1 sugar ABC transporter substrate-binding protein [Nocardiopsis gilva YIM 90087]
MRIRPHASIGALVTAAALAVSGCGIGGNTGTAAPQGEITGEVTGEITFQTWNLKADYSEYFNGVIAAFEKEHPGATVKWLDQPAEGYAEKLSVDAAAGELPDVVNVAPDLVYPLAKAELVLDIDEARPEASKAYLPDAWSGFAMPGRSGTYAYPWYLNTGPIFYNRALFEQAGLDPDAPPTSYDELFDQAITMAEATDGEIAMLGQTPGIVDLGLYGSQLMNEDGTAFTFNDAAAVEMIQRYKEMYDAGALVPESLTQDYTGSGEQFMSEAIAWAPGSAYDLDNFRTNAPSLYKNVGITEVLTNTGQAHMYLQGLAVSARTSHPATATAFAEFVTNAENQEAFAHEVQIFPSTVGSLDDPYFTEEDGTDEGRVRVAAATQLATATNYTPVRFSDQMQNILRNEIALAMRGDKTPRQALDAAVDECNSLLDTE